MINNYMNFINYQNYKYYESVEHFERSFCYYENLIQNIMMKIDFKIDSMRNIDLCYFEYMKRDIQSDFNSLDHYIELMHNLNGKLRSKFWKIKSYEVQIRVLKYKGSFLNDTMMYSVKQKQSMNEEILFKFLMDNYWIILILFISVILFI